MRDTGGHDLSNTMQRSRSRSPRPPHMRMPSPASPTSHSEANAAIGGSSFFLSTNPSPNYGSYSVSHKFPSIPRSTPAPFPPTQIVHEIHYSKHHSSSMDSDSQIILHSPSSISSLPLPITQSTSFPPQIRFPAISHQQPIQSSGPSTLHKPPPPGYIQSKPPPQQVTKNTPNRPKHYHYPIQTQPTISPVDPLNPDFQYSKCTGRRRALCIGINYRGQENELKGCVNDANNVRNFLRKHNYKSEEIMLLTDETNDPRRLPTRNNILEAMRWLVHNVRPHDSLFFHYSGHGGQIREQNADDEVIYPLDFKRNGVIVDDLTHDIMVKPLPRGSRLTGLFNACHSGSVLDLPYIYSSYGRLKRIPITAILSKATHADVISWSARHISQTSADTFIGGVAVGAMTHAFITAIQSEPDQTYEELLRYIRWILNNQKPQLSSSYPIDMNIRFIF